MTPSSWLAIVLVDTTPRGWCLLLEVANVRRFGVVVVRGRSMLPSLRPGDRLLVAYDRLPKAGDLVVVRLPGGRPVAIKRATHRESEGWWVERDNPDEGLDSWALGAIADQDVLAVVRCRIWPSGRGRSAE